MPDESTTLDSTGPDPKKSGKNPMETGGGIDTSDLAALLNEVTQDDLSPLSPEEGLEMYLQVREEELSASTLRTHESRLSFFVEWCDEVDVKNLNDISGRDLLRYHTWRSDGLGPASLKSNMRTLRLFLDRCVNFDAVPPSLPEKVDIPSIDDEDVSRDGYVSCEHAEQILEHLDQYEYASAEHVVWLLMTAAGLRVSAIRACDIGDYASTSNGVHLHLKHRPDSETPLKNKSKSERIVHLSEYVGQVLKDYVDTQRPETTDKYGREPLLASGQGRIVDATFRKYAYKWTRPCVMGRECPEGVPKSEVTDCEAMQSASHAYKCPGSSSPHTVRRGYITHELKVGVPKEVVSDRCDVSADVIDKHYDERSEEDRTEQRTDVRDITYRNENESAYAR